MKIKEKFSITDQIKSRYALHGVAWLITGFFEFFDNLPCRCITIAALITSIYLLVRYMFANKEMEDEMAELNLYKAKASALDSLKTIVCIVLLITVASDIVLNTSILLATVKDVIVPILFIGLGVENLLIGVFFNHFDKE